MVSGSSSPLAAECASPMSTGSGRSSRSRARSSGSGSGSGTSGAREKLKKAVHTTIKMGGMKLDQFDAAARVFGLVFAIENLFSNLGDFEERIEEAAARKD